MILIIIFILLWPTTSFYFENKGRYYKFFGQGFVWAWLSKGESVLKIEWDQEVKNEDRSGKGDFK